ncbi:translocation/assembly module TamB domain-containing protein [Sulfitobacter noctilucicola]|uniref:translocation/assembly module TamB domain-containing protein n=1 Tax=Sulfitobacter noctilucicola TaxID=1342301 RepID=UPI001F4CAB44|nr:translocation/assembly module TamB domain-containing protein [Sulfitobacter noctilucicola]
MALSLPSHAQEDDKGFLTRTIQNALSGTGRTVSIDGFAGALSSAASFDKMTIADAEGIWLILEDVVLDWNRSALLRGRLEVESLTAQRLSLPRLPVSEESLPDAEATPFSLPELPVSVRVETFSIAQIDLGAPILGVEAQLEINASATLNDDIADVELVARRTDGTRGAFVIEANYERSDTILDLLVQVSEGQAGIASRLLNIPGQPSIELEIAGSGPLSEFTADVEVATDGEPRLAGEVTLGTQASRRSTETPDRIVQADIGGDITALLAPRYREFFGEDVRLKIDALLEANGAVDVNSFSLKAQAADLQGKVTLDADKWPTLIDITGKVAGPDGTAVLLPVGGEGTTVESVDLVINYDQSDDEQITANFDVAGLRHTEAEVAQTTLALDGILQPGAGTLGSFEGDVTFAVQGLDLTDPALAEAVGQRINGRTTLTYTEEQPIRISDLVLEGTDFGLRGAAVIDGLSTGLKTDLDATLTAGDLSRFSALAGREMDGQTELALKGEITPLGGQFDLTAKGITQDLAIGISQVDPVLAGRTDLSVAARRDETGTFLRDLVLENAALSLTGSAALRTDDSQAQAEFLLNDLSLVVPQYEGPVRVTMTATQDVVGWSVDADTSGPYGVALTLEGLATGANAALDFTANVPEMQNFVEQIEGPVSAQGTLRKTEQGWNIITDATGPYSAKAALDGELLPSVNLDFDVSVPDIQPLVPQVSGAVTATGNVQQTENGFVIDTKATGPYNAQAAVQGLATGADMNLDFEVSVPDVRPLVPGVSGPLAASGQVRQSPDGILIDATANGPYNARAAVQGLATGPNMRIGFDVSLPNVQPLVPTISGALSARGDVRQSEDGIVIDTTASGPYSLQAAVQGLVTGPNANVTFSADMPNIGALVDNINGPLSVDGTARKEGSAWRVQTDADGPSGTQATVSGVVGQNGTLDLAVAGNAPLGLTRPFLEPRDLQGQARFDLRINGQPALSSVSGTIRTSNASLSAPNLRVGLTDINADVQLANSRAQIDLTGQAVNGGSLRVGGFVALTGGLAADLRIGLSQVVLIDPNLYRTEIDGALQLNGPLTGGAQISGQVDVGETNVTVPSTGLTSIGDIPPINHIGATRPVIATRRKAGIENAQAGVDPADDGGAGFGLNVRVSAPNRIFVRGRGLDAELGGALRLTGTTNRVISAGRFDLQRGRLDILGKRFDLREGAIQFQGDLVPYIRFVSATTTSTGEVRVVVEGPADEPVVTFEATPDAPQDEVLAQLLFGRNLSEISAIQALQLANAVATLAGRGGTGVISNLREGFGLDDLDVTTTDDGATAVRAGKYLSENVYTDVTAASDGTGEISLNLDITPNLTGKATLESDGNSGIGIFFEKDY